MKFKNIIFSKSIQVKIIYKYLKFLKNIYNKNEKLKGYNLGPIVPLSHRTGWKAILDSHEDISLLIRLCKTKYSKEVVDDSVMRILWSFYIRFSGAGLFWPDTDY